MSSYVGWCHEAHARRTTRAVVREMMVKLVLGTEMKVHFKLLSEFRAVHSKAIEARREGFEQSHGPRLAFAGSHFSPLPPPPPPSNKDEKRLALQASKHYWLKGAVVAEQY
jgi:hypothetical protein